LVFDTVKHNLSYKSMECANKLSKDIFYDSDLAKISCGLTKAETIVKKCSIAKRCAKLHRCVEGSSNVKQLMPPTTKTERYSRWL
jgi:hypothetical protein